MENSINYFLDFECFNGLKEPIKTQCNISPTSKALKDRNVFLK